MLTVTLTDKAIQYFKSHMKSPKQAIFFGIKKTGCNGWAYVLEFTETQKPEWTALSEGGLTFYMKSEDLPIIGGTVIDYEDKGFESRIIFKNPNTKSECGCGESFNIEKE